MKNLLYILLIFPLFISCSDDYFNPVEGTWRLDLADRTIIATYTNDFQRKSCITYLDTGYTECNTRPYRIDKNNIYFTYGDIEQATEYVIFEKDGNTYLRFINGETKTDYIRQ